MTRPPRHLCAPLVFVLLAFSGTQAPAQQGQRTATQELLQAVRTWGVEPGRVARALRAGADPNARYADDSAAISLSAAREQRPEVEALYRSGARLEGTSFGGPNGLHLAAGLGQPEMVRALLEAGADPNAYGELGYTPLLQAIYKEGAVFYQPSWSPKYWEVVELLLGHGAKLDLVKTGTKPLFLGAPPSLNQGATALILAARTCADTLVRLLLDAGAQADAADGLGQSPLMAGADGGCPEAVAMLLRHNAKVSQTDGLGRTALQFAANRTEFFPEHVQVVRQLLAAGADPSAALTRLKEMLGDRYYREYPIHGRNRAEEIRALLKGRPR